MNKRFWLLAVVLAIMCSLLLNTPIGHARSTAGQKNAGFWWDNDTLIFTGVNADVSGVGGCQDIKTKSSVTSQGSSIHTLVIDCLKKEDPDNIPTGASLNYVELPVDHKLEYSSIPDGVTHEYTLSQSLPGGYTPRYFCEIENKRGTNMNSSSESTLKGCWRLKEEVEASWAFTANGQEADGSTIFINDQFATGKGFVGGDGDTARVYVNNNSISKIDVDHRYDSDLDNYFGDIRSYVGSTVRGEAGIMVDQSAVQLALDEQKTDLEREYYDNCRKRAGTVTADHCQKKSGAFDVIWKSCAVVTGSGKGDLHTANNCLKTYAGVELKLDEALATVPPDPIQGSMYKCNIDLIGYVICPLMNFMAKAADGMFSAMKRLLHISPLDRNEQGGRGAYNAWVVFRNVANVILVIAILAITLSQVSNFGISSYGAKKALPKLIVGGIILNASFFISATLLDISNILGDSLHSVLLSINESLPKDGDFITAQMGGENTVSDGSGTLLNWSFIIGLGLAGAGVVLAVVMMFVPILTAVIIALLVVIMMLLARHALIILLTVIAPIALILYVLPNTKQWFSKWRTHYFTLLMMYPAIAIIFGLSTIAANVILQIGTADESMTIRLFALAIQTAPLMVTPIVMRMGGQTLGNIGNSIRNSGVMRGAQSTAKNTQNLINNTHRIRALRGGRGPLGALYRAKKIRDDARGKRKGELSQARARYVSEYIQGKQGSGGEKVSALERMKERVSPRGYEAKTKAEKYQDILGAGDNTGESRDMAVAYARNVMLEEFNKDAKAHKLTMKGLRGEALHNELERISDPAVAMDEAYKQAVIETAFESASEGREDEDAIRLALQASGQVSEETRGYMLRASHQSHLGAFMSNPQTRQAVMTGDVNAGNFSKQVIAPTINSGVLSPGDLQIMARVGGLDAVQAAKTNGHLTYAGRESLAASAGEILNSSSLRGGLTPDQETALRRLR